MPLRTDGKVIILILLITIILALGGLLVAYVLGGRLDYPPGTFETEVSGTKVVVRSDPKLAVTLVSTPPGEQNLVQDGGSGDGTGGVQDEPTPVVVPSLEPTPVIVPTLIPTPVPVDQVILQPYTVGPGDTLYSISNRFNTSIPLMARYGISGSDIVPGNVIQVPVANPAFCPGNQPYVVLRGDTLSGIARKCGTTVDFLNQINDLNGRLDETSVICVPVQP